MTFFYDLNKKLDSIREKPEVTHGQLNERDMGKHNNKTTGFDALAKKAGGGEKGEKIAGAQFQKMKKAGQLEEEGMSRAAKGYEKYGKEGMQALAKAGREGKALDPVRNRYDKYDESQLNELSPELLKRARDKAGMKYANADDRKDQKASDKYNRQDDKFNSALRKKQKDMDEGMGDVVKKIGGMAKKVGGAVLNKLGHGSDEDMRKDLQRKMGMPQTGKKPEQVKEKMSPAKSQSFAALAPPKDKITFADKIAGAKKEVDEMLGDVAAEAIKGALSGKQKQLDKNQNGKLDANDFAMLRKGGKKQVADEGWDDMMKDTERRRTAPKIGSITHGSKHDVEEIPGGRRVTRRVDPNTGHSVGADDDGPADGEKRGRGRPKGTKGAIGAKGPSGKSKLMNKEASHDENPNIAKAKAILKRAGYTVTMDGEEDLEEKAVSKKQQRFMGMVHATQKGEKAPSKEVGKVAKTMGKKDAEDFASTKHKGLPEKKKPEVKKDDTPKKKEKTEEQGGTGTPTASSGFSYGKGIYDSLDRDVEAMIAEGMNVNMSMNSDANGGPSKSLTVTATDDDALKLGQLLKMAGLGGGDYPNVEGGADLDHPGAIEINGTMDAEGAEDLAAELRKAQHDHVEGAEECPACGSTDCGCDEVDEAAVSVSDNQPDWPTDQETAQDNFEYSGGLNKPKSTGQSTTPVLASQDERQITYEADLQRIRDIAGIREAKKVDEDDMEEGNKFTGNLAKARADGKTEADLDGDGKMEKVDEGILASTANLWKAYKGQYGV
jgi:hypothetical protein